MWCIYSNPNSYGSSHISIDGNTKANKAAKDALNFYITQFQMTYIDLIFFVKVYVDFLGQIYWGFSDTFGVYISQLIRYARVGSSYDQFLNRGSLLIYILMLQGFVLSQNFESSTVVLTIWLVNTTLV
jgi:hypothetical protein